MNPTPPPHEAAPRRRFRLVPVVFLLGAMAGLALVYGIAGFPRNAGPEAAQAAACRPAAEAARLLAPLMRGEIAALTPAKSPADLSGIGFADGEGRRRTLADWTGRTVLLNLWATWCVPCRKEMPALDALQAKLGGADFEVVAVNIDTRDADKPKAWLQENGIVRLAYYADPTAKIFQDLKAIGRAFGMPTTILIDARGCEVATLAGPAEWASPEAVALIEAALKR